MEEIIYRQDGCKERVDSYLKKLLGFSREKIKGLLAAGKICVNGRAVEPAYNLRPGDRIDVLVKEDPLDSSLPVPQKADLNVIYEDGHILVVNKPAGILTHPTHSRKEGTLLNFALAHSCLAGGDPDRPGIVHRLDRDTSGAIVMAKTEAAYENLVRQFSNRQVNKVYLAVVKGFLPYSSKNVEFTIQPDKKEHTSMDVRYLRGKKTITIVERIRYIERSDITIVMAKPVTGRTHQVRLALASEGYPIIGDEVYGALSPLIGRVALHSYRISFNHPGEERIVRFTASLPADLELIIKPEDLRDMGRCLDKSL